MRVIDDLSKADLQQETVLTIGVYDGLHRGHQTLIGQVVARARTTGRLAALITFHPHPAEVLAPGRAPRYLTMPGEKVALLEGLGVDLVVVMPFDRQLAATPYREFMEMLAGQLRLRELWVGADFALGRDREGDVAHLRALGPELGYEVHIVEPVIDGGEAISSSRIRKLLDEGQVGKAAQLLGRYPRLSGEVVIGAERGRNLGFPTANVAVRSERAVPANGVYAVYAVLGSERYPAVVNIGVRPSFDNGQKTVEVHILDFNQDIYGCDLVVEFVARLRDERRFGDIDDLIAQIGADVQAARHILGGREAPAVEETACPHRYHEVEHTADRALWVWGRTPVNLFAGAAQGMYSLMADVDGLAATDWRQVRLEALDREALLVDWLNELLFLTETEGLLFVEFVVEALEASGATPGASLVARVGGVPGSVTKAQIKAVTFHNLAVAQENDGWATLITFDV